MVGIIRVVEPSKQFVGRLIPTGGGARRFGSSRCLPLQLQVDVQVDLCGVDVGLSKPERDHAGIDASLQ